MRIHSLSSLPTVCLACALLSLLSACSSTETQSQQYAQERENIESLLQQQIAEAPCTEQRQCRVLPVGAKPCGGASHFLVYSTANTNEEALQKLAARHSQISAQLNRDASRVGSCQLAIPPLLYCKNQHCVGESRD